jgi:hypothetical protein
MNKPATILAATYLASVAAAAYALAWRDRLLHGLGTRQMSLFGGAA